MSTQILLHSKTSKRASNVNNSLTIPLKSSKRLLPIEPKSTVINEMELYNAERKASNLLRLNFSINTIATNACFNNITEIVKRLYQSEKLKELYPDKNDRLKHIFE